MIRQVFLTALSLALIVGGLTYLQTQTASVADGAKIVTAQPTIDKANSTKKNIRQEIPNRIISSDINLNIAVNAGKFDTSSSTWDVGTGSAYYASSTGTPLIYAHNTSDAFGNLKKINSSTEFELIYADTQQRYSYIATRFIDADDGKILTEESDNMIMLMTCSGLFNEQRRIVYLRHIG